MKNTALGTKVEQMYCRKLLNDGWIVRRWPRTRFSSRLQFTGQDLWGTDIIAKKDGKTRYIQVKSSSRGMPGVLTETLESLKVLWSNANPRYESVWWVGYNVKTREWKELELSDIPALLAGRGK